MRLNDIKIGTRLNVIISVVVIILLGVFSVYNYQATKTDIIETADNRMYEQLDDIVELINVQVKENQNYVENALDIAHEVFHAQGDVVFDKSQLKTVQAVNQITGSSKQVDVPLFLLDSNTVYQNYDVVDKIRELTGATATVFQKIEGGYLRISTNVMKTDGSRAVGTYIPASSEVIKTVESGQTYQGRAFVVDDYYITAYEPIYVDGMVSGILYVGVREKDLAGLKDILYSKTFFDDGYAYLVDNSGELIIHPTQEGDNISDQAPFKQMQNADTDIGKSRYKWPENEQGRWKYQYFEYYEPIDSYVVVTFYEETLFELLREERNVMVIITVIAIILFVLINFFLSRSISQKLNRGVNFADAIAEGDLSEKLDIQQQDEVGTLASAMNRMMEKLRSVIDQVDSGAGNITSASQQMSSSSQQVSQGSSEQASSAEEVSSSMEEMVSNIQQNSDNSQQTEKISTEAAKKMHIIMSSAKENKESIEQIADKISIIDDIAFQTNILALNASVEAARAGEYGKGFANVANEVRKLAEKSKVASDEINSLSKKSVNKNTRVSELFEEMVPEVEKTAQLLQEISAASLEQNSGADQVNNAIQQLNQVTQQNAAASEELATSSEELASQAEQLKDLIAYFSLKK